jgi:transketolase
MNNKIQRAHALRFLAMDAVEKAKSGHPGMPMGMADIAQVLWADFLQHHPQEPCWWNRDRFVLSNGHGSMLLYALLHLTGYDLPIEELQQFRQLHSKTPGHPEFGLTPGVETTTGPLGQGIANAVGMALAERCLAAQYNRQDFAIIDHYTYVFAGDGCLMEGISHEACSLAGVQKLGKLILFWDDNGISIDGPVQDWYCDDNHKRFTGYGWQVLAVDGHNPEAIREAIEQAQSDPRPTLIACKTVIGFGSPNLAGQAKTHGAPLGSSEVAAVREKLNWPYAPFEIPDALYEAWDARAAGSKRFADWKKLWQSYIEKYPEQAQELKQRMQQKLPEDFADLAQRFTKEMAAIKEPMATRKASFVALGKWAQHCPALTGGSADLTCSNLTNWQDMLAMSAENPDGRYLYYGVREFAMFAVMNGLALSGMIPFAGTFLTFLDYGRNALRLAALMGLRVIYVLTHDSIGLGEDGPTHQPIEHLAIVRATPNVDLWRPADAYETMVAWNQALLRQQGPTCLALSRQSCPQLQRGEGFGKVEYGAYQVLTAKSPVSAVLIATGSEVGMAVEIAHDLAAEGMHCHVVSIPCLEMFARQSRAYRDQLLPEVLPRFIIEAAHPQSWMGWCRPQDRFLGLSTYGHSAPAEDVFTEFGLTTEQLKVTIKEYFSAKESESVE